MNVQKADYSSLAEDASRQTSENGLQSEILKHLDTLFEHDKTLQNVLKDGKLAFVRQLNI